jgi:hypothetical protein
MTRNVFNSPVARGNAKNIFNAATYSGLGLGLGGKTAAISGSCECTPDQVNFLTTVYNQYVTLLANKNYEQIPSNYQKYIALLNQVKSIKVKDYKLQTLLYVVENGLVGSMNANNLYQRYAYDEIKVGLLNKRIKEILSDKNVKETISSTTGQFQATKTFKLSPLFSYYIYLYGMPEYGVGFDPVKLAFVRSLPFFQNNEDILDDTAFTAASQ